ncbi:hypothetical protein ONE63_007223 [Megalurothrips usitatus]|uniref:Nephrin-like n=1 Tax=Megalurothrips usitatus TaxID=439358 RepID=A0AAV7XVK6_9NEOP|nr:hypothetical protein ONE63_007223 [Megalurothrips usitatus]
MSGPTGRWSRRAARSDARTRRSITAFSAPHLLQTTQDQNSTTSTLIFTPVIEDQGLTLSCRGSNPRIPNTELVDSWTLDIHHAPVVTLQLGRPLNASALTEGVDVFFECHIKANPRIFRVGWRHDRQPLIQNASAGTIISNQSLVLQSVSRARAGMYTCVAVNQEGDGESNPVQLDVKYKPVCRPNQQSIWGVGRGETITIPCDVDSNPDDVQFTWRLNTTSDSFEISPSKHTADRARSFLTHTPQSERDYGTLLCWGSNFLGAQKHPCAFLVIPAGKPNSPVNCSLANQTTESLTVTCSEGFDGGLPRQKFALELYDEQTHSLVTNVSELSPSFTVIGLESGLHFVAELYAYNSKGRSEAVRMHASTVKGAERRLAATQAALQITPLVGLLVGVVASLVLAAVLIVVVLRMRGRGESNDEKSEDGGHGGHGSARRGKGDGKGDAEPAPPQDENNPDLIPDKSADDFVDPDEKAFEYLNDRRLYSTLNPRLGLYSPSTLDHMGPGMPNGPKMASQISSLQPLLETRCNTIGGHGHGKGLGGKPPPAVTATRF